MAKVKGTKITSKLAFVRAQLGEDAEARVLAALSEEDRDEVRRTIEIGWYPQELYERLVRAVVDAGADGDLKILDRMGAYSAEAQGRGPYRTFFRAKDPVGLLQSMAPMHAMLNKPGEMTVEPRTNGHVTMRVKSPQGNADVCRLAQGFYRRAVELCGVKEVTVREVECSGSGAEACRFEVRWR